MADNAQKTPLARSLNKIADNRIRDALQTIGKQLPCSITEINGWIVQVKFEVQTKQTLPKIVVPVFSSLYDFLPLQVGDKGVVMTADTYLGGVSGLGGGVAVLPSAFTNLGPTLGFVPIGNKNFPAPVDTNKRQVQGPKGVIIQTTDGTLRINLDKDTGDITLTATGKINLNGELWINGKKYLNHEHSGVATGASDSGPVVDP